MTSTSPPPEAQRFGRSQTPESPRPVHIPEPANIPVLLNQMDPVFNDTATYNIPHNQTFSPFPDPTSEQGVQSSGVDEHDAVQNFLREAEHQAAAEPEPSVNNVQNALQTTPNVSAEANPFSSVTLSESSADRQEKDANIFIAQSTTTIPSEGIVPESTTANQPEPTTQQRTEELSLNDNLHDQPQQPQQEQFGSSIENEGGVDYQSLLDTISQSASTAPTASNLTAPTTVASSNEDGNRFLHSVPGLPPKPPPQERPIEFPSYSSYENASAQNLDLGTTKQGTIDAIKQSGNEGLQGVSADSSNLHSASSEAYSSLPHFNNANQTTAPPAAQLPMLYNQMAPGTDVTRTTDPLERPWSPRTQVLYDQFLEDERRYVTEGIWDKFPLGSRLFVGNLPSEKVTKRDLFHKFHKHGQLAQISIKQAYGFVQFLEAASCLAALAAEQGVEIRGRKVHLEVSKPQKNTRNAAGGGGATGGGGGGGGGNKNQQRRRSRSPDRNSRRDNRNYSDFRDEPGRRRDDFRNKRSPSPRGYRQRDDFRPGGRDGRSRSPLYGNKFGSPSAAALDEETSLQLPRRDPRQVPDVQLLVLEQEVVQSFINWVEQGFRNKGLQASTIWMNNRFSMSAVVKRQIIEGVQAVVKLTRVAQNNSKIPLQVFDRSAGASNVTYNEYVDLDVHIAADVVLQARQKERGAQTTQPFRPQVFSPPAYQPPAQYGGPQPPFPYLQTTPSQYPPQQQSQQQQQQPGQQPQYPYPSPQQGGYRPPPQPPTPTNQPPNLQQLLATLRQPPSHSASQNLAAAAQNGQSGNIANFMGNLGGGQQPYGQGQPANYGQYSSASTQQAGQHSNVQNVMEQLARYHR